MVFVDDVADSIRTGKGQAGPSRTSSAVRSRRKAR